MQSKIESDAVAMLGFVVMLVMFMAGVAVVTLWLMSAL